MKAFLISMFLVLSAVLCAADDYFDWYRVMTDSATPATYWVMSSSDKGVISKKLNLMVPVSELREAAFEYEILVNPYDPKRKVHVPFKNHPWADLLLKVNGHEVFRGPAGPHILVGTHAFPFPVEYLKEGENLLELCWAPLKPEEKGSRSYGYIYVACDLTEELQDVKGPQTRLAKAPESLRMRLLIK
ncbi:MAG: hypothetical protein IJT83_00605 [Victivallales bacterium]|nr:hypothetical protein [Victivallales bacterium]